MSSNNVSLFEKSIKHLENIFESIYVKNGTAKIVELEGNNIIIKTLTLISMIALIIVYFFYILSFILHSFGIDIWFNSAIIIFVIFVIFFILFFFLSFIIGFAINKNNNASGIDNKKNLNGFFETVSHLLMNILFVIPVILSLSLMWSILKLHFDIKLSNIPKDIIKYTLIWLPVGILVLLIIFGLINKSQYKYMKYIYSLLSGIFNISTILLLSFVFSFIIEKLMKMWYKNEKDCKPEEPECGGEPEPVPVDASGKATPTIMNTNTALYKNKISIYFATEDSCNPENKFWLIGIIIYVALVIATFLMHYILLYQPDSSISNIKFKGKVSIISVINNFLYSPQQNGGSKIKSKRR